MIPFHYFGVSYLAWHGGNGSTSHNYYTIEHPVKGI